MHPNFNMIVQKISQGASVVLINTNGTLLKKYRQEWENSPLNCKYVVNYHGTTEKVYDDVSGKKGYYKVVMEGIEMLADAGMLYRLNTACFISTQK